MAAKDYKLCISPLTGSIFISKVSKRHKGLMLTDRVLVDKSEFIHVLLQWVENEKGKSDTVSVTENGKVILEIVDKRKR